jgi:hypothetical protein
MKNPTPHLADEHMNLYEWSGGVASFGLPVETRRPRRWHASYGALAALTSLLVLNGCDRQEPTGQPEEQIQQPAAVPGVPPDVTPRPETSTPPASDGMSKP